MSATTRAGPPESRAARSSHRVWSGLIAGANLDDDLGSARDQRLDVACTDSRFTSANVRAPGGLDHVVQKADAPPLIVEVAARQGRARRR